METRTLDWMNHNSRRTKLLIEGGYGGSKSTSAQPDKGNSPPVWAVGGAAVGGRRRGARSVSHELLS